MRNARIRLYGIGRANTEHPFIGVQWWRYETLFGLRFQFAQWYFSVALIWDSPDDD